MHAFAHVVTLLDVVLFGGLALVCLSHWRARREAASRWLAVTFGVLAVALFSSLFLSRPAGGRTGYQPEARALLAVLFVYPYSLYRFGRAFQADRRLDRLAVALTALLLLATAVMPLPSEPGSRPWYLWPVLAVLFVQWGGLSTVVARWLWRAGSGLATVARRRMRLMALGAGASALALVPSAVPGDPDHRAAAVVVAASIIPVVSAVLFFVGYVPPAWLRALWRRDEQAELRNVELSLITAETAGQVAARMLPHAAALVGGSGALLVAPDGSPIGATGSVGQGTQIVVELAGGRRLVVEASPYAPVFGAEEIAVLEGLGAFVDLVLARVELLDREVEARRALARTNDELETLVYGISHDLRSPLVSLTGYLGYLRADYGDALAGEGAHYLHRMEVSARYMEALIADLLELSRVGRIETDVDDVDLGHLVDDIAAAMGVSWPGVTVEATGLPVVRMNEVRARQLFTNLFENAARHGGRSDLTITVTASPPPGAVGAISIDVADDGGGIPAEYAEKIFGIFERLNRPDADTPGTGIGLALCRRIVETAGGEIVLVAPGPSAPQGAHFRFTLPLATAPARPRRAEKVVL